MIYETDRKAERIWGSDLILLGYISQKKKFLRRIVGISFLIFVLIAVLYFMAAARRYSGFSLDTMPQFAVTSDNLHDGKWDAVITNTKYGQNHSPQLGWQRVEGAEVYVIYMIDTDAGNWLHMKAEDIQVTALSEGELKGGYIGPYPPLGTHTYEVYVFALAKRKDSYPGILDGVSDGIAEFAMLLNTYDNGDTENIISYGKLSGTYSHGDR